MDYFTQRTLEQIDKIFVLSEYHRGDLPALPDEKFYVTRNGIDPSQFAPEYKATLNQPNKFIYASSPDRGLEIILDYWPKIREMVPDAELHIYYGFTKVFDMLMVDDPNRRKLKEKIMRQCEELDGVHYHGRIGHQELADVFRTCGAWLYPSIFTEISCITAMKAQASGCWPVTNDLSALKETVKHGYVINGEMATPGVMDKWLEAVGRAVTDVTPESRQLMREDALECFSWKTLAMDWSEKFKEWKYAKDNATALQPR